MMQDKIFSIDDELEFIAIPAGTFTMGALHGDEHAAEIETQREIRLTESFAMQRTPVTVKQYLKFTAETGHNADYKIEIWDGDEWVLGPDFSDANNCGDFPVIGVSYFDTLKFIEWASKKYKVSFRLPTEAEFEYAAKQECSCSCACKKSLECRELKLTRDSEELKKKVYPVKNSIAAFNGLQGMHGLIWQWCEDWFYFYDPVDIIDPSGPKDKPEYAPWRGEKWTTGKVIRGGSFSYPYHHSRCSNRHYAKLEDRNYNVGFRLSFSI
ncbi:formylglycine-generating enzyme family protein [Mesobacillus zeae]|uniref:Formylglycine-generating enzyme family protein n=1 Tax=Mesobacillus zeae TaxID=1917180 RepID=A0A398BLZ7_9BACI|nr:formylglycine-generating enzyme family protein [Mesobacillus zeae]RID88790.1 formylglycine-generating enzyme family protein [Mesobacillus zeae]